MKYLIVSLYLLVSINSFSQHDSLSFGKIIKSDCLLMDYLRPQMIAERFHGDTLNLKFLGSINCSGFHNPVARISGDSITIHFENGELVKTPWAKLPKSEQKYYADQGIDTVSGVVEQLYKAACVCSFLFDIELLGVNQERDYCYYFSNSYNSIEDSYLGDTTGKKIYQFRVRLGIDESIKKLDFTKDLGKIVKENSGLKETKMLFDLTIDPLTSKITTITLRDKPKNKSLEKKLMAYLKENARLTGIMHPITREIITNYSVIFMYEEYWSYSVSFEKYCIVAF